MGCARRPGLLCASRARSWCRGQTRVGMGRARWHVHRRRHELATRAHGGNPEWRDCSHPCGDASPDTESLNDLHGPRNHTSLLLDPTSDPAHTWSMRDACVGGLIRLLDPGFAGSLA